MTPLSVLRNRPSILCTTFFVPFIVLFIVSSNIMPKYIRILDDLIQEARVGLDGLVNLIKLLLVPKLFKNVLINAG